MLEITPNLHISAKDLQFQAIRAQGPGGQHVNKTSTAILLVFDVAASSLPEHIKSKLFKCGDPHLTAGGKILIKAQSFRSQEQNRQDALGRLKAIIDKAMIVRKKRRPTKPTKGSQRRRLDSKKRHGQLKQQRGWKSGQSD